MANEVGAEGSELEPTKNNGFDISNFLKHFSEIDTSIGKLYLFPCNSPELGAFNALPATEAAERIREFIPHIASLSPECGWHHKRVGISADKSSQLSAQEVEAIAEAYALSSALRFAREGGKERSPITRAADEAATTYLDRLMRSEVEEEEAKRSKMRDLFLGSEHGMFDQVWKASQALDESRQQFERLTRISAPPTDALSSIDASSRRNSDQMVAQNVELMRQRSEDREMVRLTGKMTAQSAKTLQELAAAASILLGNLEKRDKDAKHTTKVQLWIAVGSVILSALLALGSLVVSYNAYDQDKGNISSGDKWQASVLEELKVINQKSSQVEASNRELLKTIEQLRTGWAELESRLATAASAQKEAQK